jgi:hypothetical protein
VFLAEFVSSPFFSPLNPRLHNRRYSSGAPRQGSAMNAEKARALDWSAPLNAFKPSRVSRRKKIVFESEPVNIKE